MAIETIFQHEILTKFAYPFLLIFFIVFAVLEKTKLLGEDKKQINALIAFVIGLIFLSALQPKMIVSNLVLFLTVGLVVMFVALLLWGFVSGGDFKEDILKNKSVKWTLGAVVIVGVIMAFFWAAGLSEGLIDLLFKQSWSSSFWTNISFVVVIAIALALVLKKSD